MKLIDGRTDMLVLEGIEIDDLSLSWSGVGGDNLVMNIAGDPSGDRVTFISMNDDRLAGFIGCPCFAQSPLRITKGGY